MRLSENEMRSVGERKLKKNRHNSREKEMVNEV